MNVLILGAAGFLGSNLVRRCLQEKGAKVTAVDFLDPLLKSTKDSLTDVMDKITFIKGDFRNEQLLEDVVPSADIIFNCAAQTSHPLSIQYPLLDAEINCLGNIKLLEAVRRLNPKAKVVYASSSTVIGKARTDVITEEHPEKPLEIYSANKGVAEKYYEIYHTVHGLNTVVLRFGNLYGPYGKGYPEFGFLNYFIHLAWSGQEIRIFGDGAQLRNVTFVDDATEILWKAAHEPKLLGNVYFATSDLHLSLREIASTIVSVFARGKLVTVPWPEDRLKIEVGAVRFSSALLQKITGWQAKVGLEEGLRRTLEVFQKKEKSRRE